MRFEERLEPGLAVKRSVVKNDGLTGAEFGHEHLGNPSFDQYAVTVSGERHGGKHLTHAPGGNHGDALGKMTEPLSEHTLTSRAVGVGVIKGVLGSGFVNIDAVLRAQCGERRDKGRALLGVAFSVAVVVFLRL